MTIDEVLAVIAVSDFGTSHDRGHWRDRPTLSAFRDLGPDDHQMSALIASEVGEYQVRPCGRDS